MDNSHRQWEILFIPLFFFLAAMFPRRNGFIGRAPHPSLSSMKVDWGPAYKHNYILFLLSFSIWLFPAFIEPAFCRSLLFIAALSLNEGKEVETLPSVYYKPLITLSLTLNVSQGFKCVCRGTRIQIRSLWGNHPLRFSVLLNQYDWQP